MLYATLAADAMMPIRAYFRYFDMLLRRFR